MEGIRDRRAVSPVIATVILVAVAITIAVAVAYWMGGISSQYTRFEKVEVTSGYCETVDTDWSITLTIRNTGTSQATISGVLLNGKHIDDYAGSNIVANKEGETTDWTAGVTIDSGASAKIVIQMDRTPTDSAYAFSAGTTVEVSLLSAAGNTYMKMVALT